MFRVHLVFMSDLNGLIGLDGKQPYYIKDDLKHFAKLTENQTVVMGRKTYEDILNNLGHPLKGRRNLVLTNNLQWDPEDSLNQQWLEDTSTQVATVHSVAGVLALMDFYHQPIYVIGGADVYELFEDIATNIHHTKVNHYFDIDTKEHFDLRYFLPDLSKFKLVNQSDMLTSTLDEGQELSYEFLTYSREVY